MSKSQSVVPFLWLRVKVRGAAPGAKASYRNLPADGID